MAGKKYPWSKRDNAPIEGVYAGPEFFAKDTQMNDVYAGPEFFEKDPVEEPDTVGEDAPDAPLDDSAVSAPDDSAVPPQDENAAPIPDIISNGPPPEMFMCVYAGPEFYNGPNGQPAGAYMPAPAEPPKPAEPLGEGQIYCPNCGMPIYPGNFCSECGASLPQGSEE